MTTLQAQLRSNRQTQSSVSELILRHNDQAELREALIEQLLKLVAQAAELERQLLAA
jgi:hypothetical protein